MPQLVITSIDDSRLDIYRELKQAGAPRRSGHFICEGDKLVRRLLASDFRVASLLVGDKFVANYADVPDDVPMYVVPEPWVEQIIGFNFHRGVLACGVRKPSPTLEELFAGIGATCTLAICPDVQDPENLGSILRSASAFGLDGLILGDKTADPFSRRVLRVSMGASLRVPVIKSREIVTDLQRLRSDWSVESWATVLDDAATSIAAVTRPPRLALVFGSEGHGLTDAVIAACDRRVTIPIVPGVDSLNVAVAAGIFMHKATRRSST